MEAWLLQLINMTGLVINAEPDSLAFESPDWLWLIVIWPLLWWISSRFVANNDLSEVMARRQLKVKHALIHKVQHAKPVAHPMVFSFRQLVFNLLRGLAISLIAIALAQPVQKLATPAEPNNKTVRDIVFVVESSASFLLPDYVMNGQQETRMNVVKQVLDDFMAKLEGNRFGLAVYADSAFTMLPLTADQTVARLSLKRLQPYLAGRTDTAMGEALGLALKQTDKTPGITKANASTLKRVVVLISDGLSQPSKIELTEAVNYAQLLQVPIYTIGVGASNQQADKRLYTGLLYQPLEAESLQAIAQQTSGQYFQVGSGAEISAVLEQINQAEGVPYESPPSPPQKQDLSPYPLLAGLVVLAIYWLLSLFWTGPILRKTELTKVESAV
ncbi:MAG: VWA domain-containing protein [Thiomicrorhabdus sp.]|nr:VWA domain-containing protein [Thiomicrorhabdus sp.]